MKTSRLHRFVLLVCLAAAACAPAAPSSGPTVRHDPNRITREEIENNLQLSNAHDLVQRLRPGWLRVRGPDSFRQITVVKVYYDNAFLGGPESLRNIRVDGVMSLQFFDASEATQRWGIGNTQGAILVSTH